MTKKKEAPVSDAVEPEDELHAFQAEPEAAPVEQPHVAGAWVRYVAPDGTHQPAAIAARFGTHSDLLLGDGTLLEGVKHDPAKAAGTYHQAK